MSLERQHRAWNIEHRAWGMEQNSDAPLRTLHSARRKGQAVLLATLIMFIVAAVGAGFILFVQNSLNVSQRVREEDEAFLLAQAGLAFADRQLTEKGADWRPSIMVAFDEFERSRRWHLPDEQNDWYGKYAARQVVDLLGNVAGQGAFLVKVKYLPELQAIKIISIGRPKPNSPVYRRLIAYKPIPSDWIWVTAIGDGNRPDPLLLPKVIDDNGNRTVDPTDYIGYFVRLGQEINWRLQVSANRWMWLNAERDPLAVTTPPLNDPQRLNWLRLRSWLSPTRLPIWDGTTVFTSTIRVNSDLLWYGVNPSELTPFFAASQTILEVARRIQHADDDNDLRVGEDPLGDANRDGNFDDDGDGLIDEDPLTFVLVYDWQDQFQSSGIPQLQNGAAPSSFGVPIGSGFVFFPIAGMPRYMDGWERLGGILPVRWVFNFPRRIAPQTPPAIDLSTYYAQTRDADPPFSHHGYYRVPDPQRPNWQLILPNDPNNLAPGFYAVNYYTGNPNQPQPWLVFRGIYVDNRTDRQFATALDAPDVNDDGVPDPNVFVDNNGNYRPELAQLYDWQVKPPQTVGATIPQSLHPRRQQWDSGWFVDNLTTPVNESVVSERNLVEINQQPERRTAAPHLYVPPGVEVRFDVIVPDPQNNPTLVLQRTWLIRHDGQPFQAPNGNNLQDLPDPNNPTLPREDFRLAFIDPVQLARFDADNDGRFSEDPINFRDDDNDGKVDEDPPHTALQILQPPQVIPPGGHAPQIPHIVIVADGNIRVSGQVAASVTVVTPETIYVEGPLHPFTSNASIQLLARRNVCLNFAAARTPIPSLDGLNPVADRSLLLPHFQVIQMQGNINPADPRSLQGFHYLLPNNLNQPFVPFADLLGGSVGTFRFPEPRDDLPLHPDGTRGDRLVDLVDDNNNPVTSRLVFGLAGTALPLSDDLRANFTQLQNRTWTLHLILLHRGFRTDENNNPVRNPWTNLQVDIWFDDNNNGQIDPNETTHLYGPSEPMRTFPLASRWYDGDGRQIAQNNPATWKEWGILDLPIPPTVAGLLVNRNTIPGLDADDLRLSLQRLRILVTSPVAGEVIPNGRTPVRYELAGMKLALYDENGLPRPIWQVVPNTMAPAMLVMATIHAERGTVSPLPTDYFDPTAHPSWQQLVANPNLTQQQQVQFRTLQRLWSLRYLRHNAVRWTPLFDPRTLPPAIAQNLPAPLLPQSVPVLAGRIIDRVTPQTMLWRLAGQGAFPFSPDTLRFAFEITLDKLALPYPDALPIDFQNNPNPVFVEVPRTMFASTWLWAWRAADPITQGVLNLGGATLPRFYRTPVVPDLRLKPIVMVLQQQVGKD